MATPTSACANAGRVIGAVAGHGDEFAIRLLATDQVHLVFWESPRQKIVHAGFGGANRRRRQRIVAR